MKINFTIIPLMLLVLISSCSPSPKNKALAKKKVTLVYCSEGSPSNFNPQVSTDGTSYNATAYTIYDRLISFKNGTTELEPALAKSWSISQDKLTYTLNLRQKVSFHTTKYFKPTRFFNADDVLFSFQRQIQKDHPFHMVSGGIYEYFSSMDMNSIIKSVKKNGQHQIIIKLHKPEAPFLADLAMPFMSLLSAEYAKSLTEIKQKDRIDQYPIGTGPFVFKHYQKDTLIRYTAHELYFRGAAQIKKLIFAITPDPGVRYQKLKKGECDYIIDPSPSDLANISENNSLKLYSSAGLNVGYIGINVQLPPLDNVMVRRAINMALNKKSYIEAIYMGNAIIASNPIPPTLWSYNRNISGHPYDVDAAKKLLQDAGLGEGFTLKMWTLPVSRPYNPNGKKMGEMIQADLAKIGIKLELMSFDWPTFLKRVRLGEHHLVQFGWSGDNGDPDNFFFNLLGCAAVAGGSNVSKWCNKDFDKLITMAKIESDQSKRAVFYQEAQKIFQDQAPWVPIAHSMTFRAFNKNLTGVKMDPFGSDKFYYVGW